MLHTIVTLPHTLFYEVLYQPMVNILMFFYSIVGDFGIAIILLTILIKILLYPLTKKQATSQHKMKKLQPKLKELKEKYPDNKEEQSRAMFKLYKDEGVNPVGGCLPLLIQLPILIALYRTFYPGNAILVEGDHLVLTQDILYSFMNITDLTINPFFLNIINLMERNIPLAILAGALQFFSSKMMLQGAEAKKEKGKDKPVKKTNQEPEIQDILNKQMIYIFPIMTVFLGSMFPAALTLYWVTSTLVSIVQQKIIIQKVDKEAK